MPGQRLDAQNDDGDTAAHLATMRGHVKVLAVFGADMTIKNNAGKKALNIAMDKGNDNMKGSFYEDVPTYRSSGWVLTGTMFSNNKQAFENVTAGWGWN